VASPIFDFAAEFIRPLLAPERRLLLWVALSGEPADIARADRVALNLLSGDEAAVRWIRLAGKHVQFQGLPARVCLVDRELRAKFVLALNELVAQAALKAPVVIGCVDFGGGQGVSASAGAADGTTSLGAADAASPEALLAGLGAGTGVSSWVALCGGDRGNLGGARFPAFAVVADGSLEMARKIGIAFGSGTGAGNSVLPTG
jgi:urocanate hydratase